MTGTVGVMLMIMGYDLYVLEDNLWGLLPGLIGCVLMLAKEWTDER